VFKRQECIIVICNVCGGVDDCTEFVPHWDTEADALEHLDFFETGWTTWKDTHWCPNCNPPCSNCGDYFGDHEYGEEPCNNNPCECEGYVLPELPLK